jgi:hypothetical protein
MTIASVPAGPARRRGRRGWSELEDPAPPRTCDGSPAIKLPILRWGTHCGPVRGTVDTSTLDGTRQASERQYGAGYKASNLNGEPAERPGQIAPQRPVRSSA